MVTYITSYLKWSSEIMGDKTTALEEKKDIPRCATPQGIIESNPRCILVDTKRKKYKVFKFRAGNYISTKSILHV